MNILSPIKTLKKTSLLILTLGLLCACSGCGRKKIDTGQWYDYGNGSINLANVTHIQLEAVSPSGRQYNTTINQEYIDNDQHWETDSTRNAHFAIFFDNFQLTISNDTFERDEWVDVAEEALEQYEDIVALLNASRR